MRIMLLLLLLTALGCKPSAEERARTWADWQLRVETPCREACAKAHATFLRYVLREHNHFAADVPDSCLCLKDEQPFRLW